MKIVAGMGSIDDYIRYAAAGADEVFIGYVPEQWQEKYGLFTPLNRREVCFYNVQIGSFSELEILSEMFLEYHTEVTIAFNGLYFQPEQYPMIAEIMKECLTLGFNSVIVADLGLLVYLYQTGLSDKLRIHVSGEFGEINHLVLGELVRLGVRRLIFHRKVSLENMETVISAYRKMRADMASESSGQYGTDMAALEFEAFILNENCHFNGAFCNSLHCDELVPMCRMPYQIHGESPQQLTNEVELTDGVQSGKDTPVDDEQKFEYDYGLSQIKTLEKIGITHLKIVGRGANTEYMEWCIREVRNIIF